MSVRHKIKHLCLEGLFTDGGHHKQWYLEEILKILGYKLENIKAETYVFQYGEWEEGIPP